MKEKVLLLTLDTFYSTGGIQQVSRNLAYALNVLSNTAPIFNFHMLSLADANADNRYVNKIRFTGFKNHRIHFITGAIVHALSSAIVIISHINLIPAAFIIKTINRKTRIIMLAHGKEVWDKPSHFRRRFIEKHIEIWAVSNFTKQALVNEYHIKEENITVLNNCLGPFFKIPTHLKKPIRLLRKYGISKDEQILLSICRLTRHELQKGYDTIIKLMPQLLVEFPNLQYLICGPAEPEEKSRLKKLIHTLNLGKSVKLLGFIEENELTEHYLLADLFVLPSVKEGFGLVFTEAASCGCDIISGNKDGSIDAMLNGRLGSMIDPENKTAIYQTVRNHLKYKPSHKDLLTRQRICLENFGYENYLLRVKKLLKY